MDAILKLPDITKSKRTVYLLENNAWNGRASTKKFPQRLNFKVSANRVDYTDAETGDIVACSNKEALENVFPGRDVSKLQQPIQFIYVNQGKLLTTKEGVALMQGGEVVGTLPPFPNFTNAKKTVYLLENNAWNNVASTKKFPQRLNFEVTDNRVDYTDAKTGHIVACSNKEALENVFPGRDVSKLRRPIQFTSVNQGRLLTAKEGVALMQGGEVVGTLPPFPNFTSAKKTVYLLEKNAWNGRASKKKFPKQLNFEVSGNRVDYTDAETGHIVACSNKEALENVFPGRDVSKLRRPIQFIYVNQGQLMTAKEGVALMQGDAVVGTLPPFPNFTNAKKAVYLLENNAWNGRASTKQFPQRLNFNVTDNRVDYTDAKTGHIVACSNKDALENVFPGRDVSELRKPIQFTDVHQGRLLIAKEGVALMQGGEVVGTLPPFPNFTNAKKTVYLLENNAWDNAASTKKFPQRLNFEVTDNRVDYTDAETGHIVACSNKDALENVFPGRDVSKLQQPIQFTNVHQGKLLTAKEGVALTQGDAVVGTLPPLPNFTNAKKMVYLLEKNAWNGRASTKKFPKQLNFEVSGNRVDYTDAKTGHIVACSNKEALENVFPGRDVSELRKPIQFTNVNHGQLKTVKEGVALMQGDVVVGTLPPFSISATTEIESFSSSPASIPADEQINDSKNINHEPLGDSLRKRRGDGDNENSKRTRVTMPYASTSMIFPEDSRLEDGFAKELKSFAVPPFVSSIAAETGHDPRGSGDRLYFTLQPHSVMPGTSSEINIPLDAPDYEGGHYWKLNYDIDGNWDGTLTGYNTGGANSVDFPGHAHITLKAGGYVEHAIAKSISFSPNMIAPIDDNEFTDMDDLLRRLNNDELETTTRSDGSLFSAPASIVSMDSTAYSSFSVNSGDFNSRLYHLDDELRVEDSASMLALRMNFINDLKIMHDCDHSKVSYIDAFNRLYDGYHDAPETFQALIQDVSCSGQNQHLVPILNNVIAELQSSGQKASGQNFGLSIGAFASEALPGVSQSDRLQLQSRGTYRAHESSDPRRRGNPYPPQPQGRGGWGHDPR